TCTIITGEPNELVAQIHPRMPVILPEQHHAAWLGETDDGNLKALLVPYPADQMRMWDISPRVNSPKNDDPSLWEPLHGEPTQRITQRTTDALELLHEVYQSRDRERKQREEQRGHRVPLIADGGPADARRGGEPLVETQINLAS